MITKYPTLMIAHAYEEACRSVMHSNGWTRSRAMGYVSGKYDAYRSITKDSSKEYAEGYRSGLLESLKIP